MSNPQQAPEPLSASVEGWVLVPRVLPAEMLDAAVKGSRADVSYADVEELWPAMLAAAPSPPVPDPGTAGLGEDVPDWLLEFVLSASHSAKWRALPGVDYRRTAERAEEWAASMQARRAEMLRTAAECDEAQPGSGQFRRGVAQGLEEAVHDFMRDVNAPELSLEDCAKLLIKRLKLIAAAEQLAPVPAPTRTTGESE